MSDQPEFKHTRKVVEEWTLPLSGESSNFATLSEMVREAHLEVEGRMRSTEYRADAVYAVQEIDYQDHLVITLVYPDPRDDEE